MPCERSSAYGDQIRYGMQILAARAQSASDVGGRRRNNSVEAFLEEHILGLVARVSEVVNDTRDERSVLDKRIAVKAVEEMALLGKQSIRLARPQVRLHSRPIPSRI